MSSLIDKSNVGMTISSKSSTIQSNNTADKLSQLSAIESVQNTQGI